MIRTTHYLNFVAFKAYFAEKKGRGKDCLPEEKRIIINLGNDGKNVAEIIKILNCSCKNTLLPKETTSAKWKIYSGVWRLLLPTKIKTFHSGKKKNLEWWNNAKRHGTAKISDIKATLGAFSWHAVGPIMKINENYRYLDILKNKMAP